MVFFFNINWLGFLRWGHPYNTEGTGVPLPNPEQKVQLPLNDAAFRGANHPHSRKSTYNLSQPSASMDSQLQIENAVDP